MDDNEFQTSAVRTAAKIHICGECKADIEKGTKYIELKWVYDGRWWQERICPPCGELRQRASVEEPRVREMVEFVTGYHSQEAIDADELLSGFLARYYSDR